MRLAGQLFQLSDDRVIRKRHAGVSQVGDELPVERTAAAELVQRYAGQREAPRPGEEILEPFPLVLPRANEGMNRHQPALLQREIVIRTPENIELHYALCGAGSRAAAYFLDLMLMSFVTQLGIPLIAAVLALLLKGLSPESDLWAAALGSLLFFALYNSYFIFFEWLLNGQTPGKRFLGIRVIKQGGYALTFFDTLLRNLLRTIDFIPAFYGVGLVSLLLTRHCQRLGDMAAGTFVVRQQEVQTQSLLAGLAVPASPPVQPPAIQLAAIPSEVVALANEFMGRRTELSPRSRQELGAELVDLVQRTSGLEPQPTQSTENFLAGILVGSESRDSLTAPAPESS